jgi:hypothetical protein
MAQRKPTPFPGHSTIMEQAVYLRRILTDDEGRHDVNELKTALHAWIDGHRECLDAAKAASDAVDAIDKASRPRVGSRQLSFYDPETYLPLGGGLRVAAPFVTEVDFDAWWAIETAEHNAQEAAWRVKSEVYVTRKEAWGKHKYWEEVEVEEFGWRP